MNRYILRRLLQTIPILWGIATAVFAMLHLVPGDPVAFMLAESGATPEAMARLRGQLGLDDPLPVQYGQFLLNAVQGNFGNSIFYQRPVVTLIAINFGFVLSGAIAVEAIYSWPGLGLLSYEALRGPDLPMLQGLFLVFSAAVIVMNLVADLLYAYLDPRVRSE